MSAVGCAGPESGWVSLKLKDKEPPLGCFLPNFHWGGIDCDMGRGKLPYQLHLQDLLVEVDAEGNTIVKAASIPSCLYLSCVYQQDVASIRPHVSFSYID